MQEQFNEDVLATRGRKGDVEIHTREKTQRETGEKHSVTHTQVENRGRK